MISLCAFGGFGAVGAVVVIAGGCRAGYYVAHVVVGATTPTTQPTVRSVLDGLVLATVPSGYQVDALTASAGAVWFFAGSAQTAALHYDDTTGLRSFVIGVAARLIVLPQCRPRLLRTTMTTRGWE